jgi:drug/metabolite transporter (DMT)-like permease
MLLMLGFAALWALVETVAAGVLVRHSPYQVVFTRYVVHCLVMLAVFHREPASLLRTRRPALQVGRSLLMLGMPASWVIASQLGVEMGTTMAVFWLSPLLILGLAAALLGERAPLRLWLAAAAAWSGALAITRPGELPPLGRMVFPAAMALTFSLYVVLTRSLRTETTRANLFYSALGVAVSLVPVMARVWVSPAPRDLTIMVAVGVLGLAGLWALDRMAHAGPVSAAAPFAFLQLPFMLGFDWLRGHAHLGPRAALGSTVIAAAAAYLWSAWPKIRVKEPCV